jgi:biopolymer transport protein ExbB
MNELEQNSELVNRLLNSRLLQTDWVLWFLLILLGVCVVVIAWKTVYFVANSRATARLRKDVVQLVGGGSLEDFERSLDGHEGIEASVLKHSLRFAQNGSNTVEQQMDVALSAGKQRMEFGLTFLGTVGANAPFVGLYGGRPARRNPGGGGLQLPQATGQEGDQLQHCYQPTGPLPAPS